MKRGGTLARGAGLALGLPALTLAALVGIRTFGSGSSDAALARGAPGVGTAETSAGPSGCDRPPSLIGTAVVASVAAHEAPSASSVVVDSFGRRTAQGSPQVFLLEGSARGGTWFRALLPVRPNGTTGYVRAADLRLSKTPYRLVIDRAAFRLTVWKGCIRAASYPIGLGTEETPTPVGRFYLASLMKPPTADTVYGSYAYGLSGYSDVIRDWRWGGVIGLHGTNDPSSIGRFSSHGCIRMRNRDIERLVRILPLGTPITIE